MTKSKAVEAALAEADAVAAAMAPAADAQTEVQTEVSGTEVITQTAVVDNTEAEDAEAAADVAEEVRELGDTTVVLYS